MTIRESLRNKKVGAEALAYRINSWQVYGEETVVLFYRDFDLTAPNLDKLLDYLALVDKLVLALPKGVSDEHIFCCQNLQSVDAIVLFEDPAALVVQVPEAKVAFEEMETPELPGEDRERIISL